MLRLGAVWRRGYCTYGGQCSDRRTCRVDLPAAQMADPALMEFHIVAVIHRFRRRGIGMFVVSEVGRDRHLFQCAIGRRGRKGELKRQQHEEEKGEEAAHGKIMAELLDDLEGDARFRSAPGGPAESA